MSWTEDLSKWQSFQGKGKVYLSYFTGVLIWDSIAQILMTELLGIEQNQNKF